MNKTKYNISQIFQYNNKNTDLDLFLCIIFIFLLIYFVYVFWCVCSWGSLITPFSSMYIMFNLKVFLYRFKLQVDCFC